MAGPDGPCPPLTDQQNVNTIIITIIAIFFEPIGAGRMAGNITLDNLVSVRDDNTVHKKAARRIKKDLA
jgi:hypothetical protein